MKVNIEKRALCDSKMLATPGELFEKMLRSNAMERDMSDFYLYTLCRNINNAFV